MKRVCCLYRVFTENQLNPTDQNLADIPMQRKSCRDFAEHMGWTIVREEQENGMSGLHLSVSHKDNSY